MATFQKKFVEGLSARGVGVCHDLRHSPYDAVLIIGGTRQLGGLWKVRRQGIPILQRLDGINWIHRKRRTGLRHFLKAERSNWLLAFIRRRIANGVVYQSEFVQSWWEKEYGRTTGSQRVVLNGVNLGTFNPVGPENVPSDRTRLLVVEGRFGGGYEIGVAHAVELAKAISAESDHSIELMVVGHVAPFVQEKFDLEKALRISWMGWMPREQIPGIDRSAHFMFSADINPACPNSVIEAMACGLPIVAYDTGSMFELVADKGGKLAPYGGDPWQLDPPDVEALTRSALEVIAENERYRSSARARAETIFGLDRMVDGYLEALGWVPSKE